jgi:hypothetical protein
MDPHDRDTGHEAEGSRVSHEFSISGGVGAIATGQYGQAIGNVYGTDVDDPLGRIDQLLRKLEADAGLLRTGEAEVVLDDVRRLHTEVHARRPSMEGLRAMLSRLTAATSSAAGLLATVEQIKELISAIAH